MRKGFWRRHKLVFLSLVDKFRKIPDHLKMATKVELIKTIQNAQSFSRPAFHFNVDQYPTGQWSGSLSSNRLDHALGYQRGYSTTRWDTLQQSNCDAGTSTSGGFQCSSAIPQSQRNSHAHDLSSNYYDQSPSNTTTPECECLKIINRVIFT